MKLVGYNFTILYKKRAEIRIDSLFFLSTRSQLHNSNPTNCLLYINLLKKWTFIKN